VLDGVEVDEVPDPALPEEPDDEFSWWTATTAARATRAPNKTTVRVTTATRNSLRRPWILLYRLLGAGEGTFWSALVSFSVATPYFPLNPCEMGIKQVISIFNRRTVFT
jgi:hypothetical protein